MSQAESALFRAGVELVPPGMPWAAVQAPGAAVVLHDPLCPLTPSSFLSDTLAAAEESGDIVVGCHPVTDTVKSVTAGAIGGTVDRDSLLAVTSPVVLPAPVAAELTDWPDAADFAALVMTLRRRFPVRLVEAPPLGRRVEDPSALLVLEAFAGLGRA